MDRFKVDPMNPESTYKWLEKRLKYYKEHFRMLPKDCDCYLMQAGPSKLNKKQALEYYEGLQTDEEIEKHGFLEQDWKGFDTIVLDFINPYLQHVQLNYEMNDDQEVVFIEINKNKNPIVSFEELKMQILQNKLPKDHTCQKLFAIVRNYVQEISVNPKYKNIATEIRNAKSLNQVRVYDFEPGTEQGTQQFYKFAKAIQDNKLHCNRLSRENMILLIRCFAMDQLE